MDSLSRKALLAGVTMAALSGPAAADSGFYFGVNAGRSDFDVSSAQAAGGGSFLVGNALVARPTTGVSPVPSLFVPGVILVTQPVAAVAVPTNADVDRSDFTWSASVGYSLNRYVSFELAYTDLGEIEGIRTSTFQQPLSFQVVQNQKLEVETIALSVLGTLPLSERWTLFARGGYAHNESEARLSFSFPNAMVINAAAPIRMDFDSDDVVVGAGVGYELSDHWSLRANYERLLDAGSSALDDFDVETIGLSAIYRL